MTRPLEIIVGAQRIPVALPVDQARLVVGEGRHAAFIAADRGEWPTVGRKGARRVRMCDLLDLYGVPWSFADASAGPDVCVPGATSDPQTDAHGGGVVRVPS